MNTYKTLALVHPTLYASGNDKDKIPPPSTPKTGEKYAVTYFGIFYAVLQ